MGEQQLIFARKRLHPEEKGEVEVVVVEEEEKGAEEEEEEEVVVVVVQEEEVVVVVVGQGEVEVAALRLPGESGAWRCLPQP